MGGLVSSLGFGGGSSNSGVNYKAGGTNVQSPISVADVQNQLNALNGDITQQEDFTSAVAAMGGLQNQGNIYNQFGQIAAGQGPNPAQAMLANATGANTANQAALMAGQRGSNQNIGLLARQAAQQGAANQQNAIGQGAALQAQQSLGALGAQAGIAGQQVSEQQNALATQINARNAALGSELGSIQGVNNANVTLQNGMNTANAGIQNTVAQGQQGLAGNLMNAVGTGFGLFNQGGIIQKPTYNYADGGDIINDNPYSSDISIQSPTVSTGPMSRVGKALQGLSPSSSQQGYGGQYNPGASALQHGGASFVQGLGNLLKSNSPQQSSINGVDYNSPAQQNLMDTGDQPAMMAAKGGKVPALVSPGEVYLNKNQTEKVVKEGKDPIKAGTKIPGKASVKGDSIKNDTVKANLEEGGMVLPRSVVNSKDPAHEAYKFVQAHMAKKGIIPKKS